MRLAAIALRKRPLCFCEEWTHPLTRLCENKWTPPGLSRVEFQLERKVKLKLMNHTAEAGGIQLVFTQFLTQVVLT